MYRPILCKNASRIAIAKAIQQKQNYLFNQIKFLSSGGASVVCLGLGEIHFNKLFEGGVKLVGIVSRGKRFQGHAAQY